MRLTGAQKNLSAKTLTDLWKLTVGVLVLGPLVSPSPVSPWLAVGGIAGGVVLIIVGVVLVRGGSDA